LILGLSTVHRSIPFFALILMFALSGPFIFSDGSTGAICDIYVDIYSDPIFYDFINVAFQGGYISLQCPNGTVPNGNRCFQQISTYTKVWSNPNNTATCNNMVGSGEYTIGTSLSYGNLFVLPNTNNPISFTQNDFGIVWQYEGVTVTTLYNTTNVVSVAFQIDQDTCEYVYQCSSGCNPTTDPTSCAFPKYVSRNQNLNCTSPHISVCNSVIQCAYTCTDSTTFSCSECYPGSDPYYCPNPPDCVCGFPFFNGSVNFVAPTVLILCCIVTLVLLSKYTI